MEIKISIPNPRKVWKDKRGVKLTMREAQSITAMLYWLRNSKAGEHYTFGQDAIKRMENVIDAQLFDGRVWHGDDCGIWVDNVFIPQSYINGKWWNNDGTKG